MFAPEPPVDDLSTSRGVVLSRAATILRSIETQPLAGGSTRLGVYGGPPSTRHSLAPCQYRHHSKERLTTGFAWVPCVPFETEGRSDTCPSCILREKVNSPYSESQQVPNESGFHSSEISTQRSRFSYKSMRKMRAVFFLASRSPLQPR